MITVTLATIAIFCNGPLQYPVQPPRGVLSFDLPPNMIWADFRDAIMVTEITEPNGHKTWIATVQDGRSCRMMQ